MSKSVFSTSPTMWHDEARKVAHGIRVRVLEQTLRQNGGYLSQACSSAEILATLYTRILRLGPSQAPAVPPPFAGVPGAGKPAPFRGAAYNGPHAPHLDRLFVSPAHYALVVYATLIEVGRMSPQALAQFNQDGSTVEMIGAEHSPGMEVTNGSLGQTLSQAGGVAMARRFRGENGKVWVFMSDGEFQEGQTWEAIQVLSHYELDNLGVYVDVNGHQCDGKVEDVMGTEPLARKVEAFGAEVHAVDGHDVEALAAPALLPRNRRPLFVLAYTNPWQGLDILRDRCPKLHYVRFRDPEERGRYAEALERLRAGLREGAD